MKTMKRTIKALALCATLFDFAAEGFAAMTWEKGNYDPASWAPTDASLNVLRPSGYLTFGPGAAYGNITKWLLPVSEKTGMILFLR